MLRIQVLGHGMIPRGYGLAPHKEFFWAEKILIQTILTDSRLKVNMQHPDGRIIPLTRVNLDKLWESYSDKYDTSSTSNKISTEVVKKPETLIDKNNRYSKAQKRTITLDDAKDNKKEFVVEKNKNEKEVIEDLKNSGVKVATDKEFKEAVEEAIKNTQSEIKKNNEVKTEVEPKTIENNNDPKKFDYKKNNKKEEVKVEEKKDEKKNEIILHPINNPENK